MNEYLFWERYRPKSIDKMILLPRIKDFFESGIHTNVILYGHQGTGKTTLARILLKGKHYKEINSSLDNGVDLLRDEILDFCTSMPGPFVRTDDKMKYVYLEEFDKITGNFQDAFKSFIETYHRNVRFVITMNNLTEVIGPVQSRFDTINFNPLNTEEQDFLKKGYFKYLKSVAIHSKTNVNDDLINKIVLKNFPDLRASVQNIQRINIAGNSDIIYSNKEQSVVFDFILNGRNTFEENYYFVMDNFLDQPDDLMRTLGRPFFSYLMEKDQDLLKIKGGALINLAKDYNSTYDNNMVDPVVHLISYIMDIKNVIKQ